MPGVERHGGSGADIFIPEIVAYRLGSLEKVTETTATNIDRLEQSMEEFHRDVLEFRAGLPSRYLPRDEYERRGDQRSDRSVKWWAVGIAAANLLANVVLFIALHH